MDIRYGRTHASFGVGSFFVKTSRSGKYGSRLLREKNVYEALRDQSFKYIPTWQTLLSFFGQDVLILPKLQSKSELSDKEKVAVVNQLHKFSWQGLKYGWVNSYSSIFCGEEDTWREFLIKYVEKYTSRLMLNSAEYLQIVEELTAGINSDQRISLIHRDLKPANWVGEILVDWENAMLVSTPHVHECEVAMYIVTYGEDNLSQTLSEGCDQKTLEKYINIFQLGAQGFQG